MNPIKKLAGQTLVYGLSSIVPRFLSYFLVPLYTYYFKPSEYGVIADLYGLVVILNIILTYGMETTYFWFSKNEPDSNKVYSTALISLISTSLIFIFITFLFSQHIANKLEYSSHPEYIWGFGLIIGIDAICAIPFVKLRKENKAFKFALIKISSVVLNVLLNLLFIIGFPYLISHDISVVKFAYSSKVGVGYIFISNIISSFLTLLLLFKDFRIIIAIDFALLKRMLIYALPLLIAGLAGGINDAIDRQFLKYMLPVNVNAMEQLGIYFANIKIAVILIVFIQTFRFAAEPFFFNYEKEKDSKTVFADIMKYFTIFCLVIFIGTIANLSIIKHFIGRDYWSGLHAVPVILLSNVFVGIYLNLSIWYKLSGKTIYGAYIIVIGSAITLLINFLFVSRYGYMASAYARLICYIIMTVICFYLGKKYYKIPYNLKEIGAYFVIIALLYIIVILLHGIRIKYQLLVDNCLIFLFIYFVLRKEKLIFVFLKSLNTSK